MAIQQLDMFLGEKKEIEASFNREATASLKSQTRLLMHEVYELKKRIAKQEEILGSLVDYILDKKPLEAEGTDSSE